MYTPLLSIHSIFRWLLLACLLITLCRCYRGLLNQGKFSRLDNSLRHWTATVAHLQLVIGIILYTRSPVVKYFWHNFNNSTRDIDSLFFALIHIVLMAGAVLVITIGSALAKRKEVDAGKFKTVCIWFTIALLIIIVAVPWPFSPLSSRPYVR
jgi:hypothetical protein